MKLKTEDLGGEALNWAVAEKLGRRPLVSPAQYQVPARVFAVVPGCERVERFDLADSKCAWDLMVELKIDLEAIGSAWAATPRVSIRSWHALRPYVAIGHAVLGVGTWDIPDELLAP